MIKSGRKCELNSSNLLNYLYEEELGFHLILRRSRRISPDTVTDLDFADDIALISEEINQAHELLRKGRDISWKIGLRINACKTKLKAYDHGKNTTIQTNEGFHKDRPNIFES